MSESDMPVRPAGEVSRLVRVQQREAGTGKRKPQPEKRRKPAASDGEPTGPKGGKPAASDGEHVDVLA